MTQQQFLAMLVDRHPIFQKEKLTTEIERQEQLSFTGQQDWQLSSSFSLYHEEPAINYAGPDQMNTINADVRLAKTFWASGARLEAGFVTGYYDLTLPPIYNIPPTLYRSAVSATWSLPLLRNKNGFLDQLPFQLKKYDIDFSQVIADERCEDFLTQAAAAFLRWQLLDEQLDILRERAKISEEEQQRAQKRFDAHLINNVDVLRAENAVLAVQQNIALLESQWRAVQAELAELAGEPGIYTSEPGENLYATPALDSLELAADHSDSDSRVIQPLRIRLEQLEHARHGLAEETKADLAAYASAKLERIDEKVYNAALVNAPTVEAGLRLSVPLEKRAAKHNLEKNQLEMNQLEYAIADVQRHFDAASASLCEQIKSLQNVLELNRQHIQATAQKTQQEIELYELGRGDFTFVLQSRDEEQSARLIYAENAYTCHVLVLQYRALMDELYRGKE